MTWDLQNDIIPEGVTIVAGLDEAGRGPLFGAVFAAAVILPKNVVIEELNDSKKLSAKKRDMLFDKITVAALDWGVGRCEPWEIDEINILNASMLAMKRAICSMKETPDFLIIDGNTARNFDVPAKTVVKGDALMPSIAAASVVAKVSRDRYCDYMDDFYPQYGIKKHKGYPTKAHFDAILKYGPSKMHRMTFLKKLYENV